MNNDLPTPEEMNGAMSGAISNGWLTDTDPPQVTKAGAKYFVEHWLDWKCFLAALLEDVYDHRDQILANRKIKNN